MRIRSSMAVSLSTAEDVSPLDSFTSILRKLATKEFASEILPRHRVIRQQIEALLQSTDELQSLCAVLHKKIYDVISRLPAQNGRQHSFQVALWPKFHVFRTQVAPRIWKNEQHVIREVDRILLQKTTLEYALVLLQRKYTCGSKAVASTLEMKGKRRETMSVTEVNAIRYASGYVVTKLKKKYMKKDSVPISRCLLSMEEGVTRLRETETDDDIGESFLAYTCAWLELVNRGGLFRVSDDVFKFFMELELCMYPMLRKRLDGSDTGQNKDELMHAIRSDEDVLFAWSLLTVHLPEIESHRLLTDIIQLWMTIRGYAIASRLVEDFKAAINQTTKGKKPLRKQLFLQYAESI